MSFTNLHHAVASSASPDRNGSGTVHAPAEAAACAAPTRAQAASQPTSPVLRLCAVVSQVARSRRQS